MGAARNDIHCGRTGSTNVGVVRVGAAGDGWCGQAGSDAGGGGFDLRCRGSGQDHADAYADRGCGGGAHGSRGDAADDQLRRVVYWGRWRSISSIGLVSIVRSRRLCARINYRRPSTQTFTASLTTQQDCVGTWQSANSETPGACPARWRAAALQSGCRDRGQGVLSAASRALLRRRRIRTARPERADQVANRRRRGSSGGLRQGQALPLTYRAGIVVALAVEWLKLLETRTRPVTKPRVTMCACRDLAQLLQVGRAYIRWASPSRAT